jgi:ERCC4-type nuclease
MLQPGEYDIILIVDSREKASLTPDKKYILEQLRLKTLACEERTLTLGDYLWIAREKAPLADNPP